MELHLGCDRTWRVRALCARHRWRRQHPAGGTKLEPGRGAEQLGSARPSRRRRIWRSDPTCCGSVTSQSTFRIQRERTRRSDSQIDFDPDPALFFHLQFTLRRGSLAKPHRFHLPAALGLLVVAAGALGASASNAFASTPTVQPEGDPLFSTQGSVAPQFLVNARTVPHWTFQYTDPTNHVTYTITMAGSDPRLGGSSEIHTVIIPLKMNFEAGSQDLSSLVNQGFLGFVPHIYNHTFDGTAKVAQTLASPQFSDFSYPSVLGGGSGQNGDVYMRAQFNQLRSGYHVKLVNYAVLPTVTPDVPTAKCIAFERRVT